MVKDPRSIRIPDEVAEQLKRWVEQKRYLHVTFTLGLHAFTRNLRAHEISDGRFILVDDALNFDVFALGRCLGIERKEEPGYRAVVLSDENQVVEIAEGTIPTKEILKVLSSQSERAH